MNLNELIKTNARGKKRVGRGTGSGKGKTSARGTKGQKARGKAPVGFIGGTLPLYKRLPYRRGLRNKLSSSLAQAVSLGKLSVFKAGAVVDMQSLIEQGIIKEREAQKYGVKIVSNGEIKTSLTVKVPTSSSAAAKIEKAGGKVVSD